MALRLESREPGFAAAFETLVATRRGVDEDVDAVVAGIIARVRADGDAALLEFTERFDGLAADDAAALRVGHQELAAARTVCGNEELAALELAADRIEAYHQHQMPQPVDYVDGQGIRLGARWRPVAAAGLYVPGGTAAYPSSVLMNAVPARVAGVARLAMAVPAPGGEINPLVLAAAGIAGVTEVWRMGGAQAIAALAFGTETIPPVDVIVGPGNAYVAAAKRRVFGFVGIDMIAGPSEVLVVADADNEPAWIAADLLAQAEHDGDSQAILITDDGRFADAVTAALEAQLGDLPRADIARRSWQAHGAVIVVETLDAALPLIDRLAPEHLELAVAEPGKLADRVHNAGAIFLGRHTPEAVGDYVAGPSHVLPTSGSARFSSGLGVADFMKRTSMVECDADGLAAVAGAAITLAEAEGLHGHARSVAIRMEKSRKR